MVTPPPLQDRWYHETVEEISAVISDERHKEVPLEHAGCQSGALPPWHEECKVFDV